MLRLESTFVALCACVLTLPYPGWGDEAPPLGVSLEAARPVLAADTGVRRRLEAGEEDTLTNLLRFGITFTKEYRIDDEYFLRSGESSWWTRLRSIARTI